MHTGSIMLEWKFRRRQGWCGACEKRFDEGERHASLLAVAGEDLARDDLCLACWTARSASGDLFHWFTHYRSGRRGLQLDLATLEALFVRLEGRVELRVREMRYVLTLLLMRKRRLKIDRILREEGGEAMLVHRPRRKESFHVHVFDFTPERLQELRADLVQLLEGAEPAGREDSGGGKDAGASEGPTSDEEAFVALPAGV